MPEHDIVGSSRGSDGMQTFSGAAVLGAAGGNWIFSATLDPMDDGTVQLSVDWTITAAGTGPNAGNHPPLLASVWNFSIFRGAE
jgi:hypothetical protein